jgi:lipopolysaccharide export system protein LptC
VNARLYDRLAALLAIFLLSILAAFTYYLAEYANRGDKVADNKVVRHEQDYFVERFTLIKLNAQGQPTFRLAADLMKHFPDDDTIEFTKPRLISLDKSKPVITVVSESGKAGPQGDITELFGNVVLTRAPNEVSKLLKMNTEYLLVDTNKETGTTDKPVKITQGASELTGIGMDFDNLNRLFALHSNVKSTWVPEKTAKN